MSPTGKSDLSCERDPVRGLWSSISGPGALRSSLAPARAMRNPTQTTDAFNSWWFCVSGYIGQHFY